MARLFHANGRHPKSVGVSPSGLPALQSLIPPTSGGAEKASLILRLLRQAALQSRETKSREFYSIRAVARHFAVPPTTVTRIYGQLNEEGVLCSIWGSKTVIEPTTLDKEIRVRGVVVLPASLKSFSTIPNYRLFFISMRDVLWKLGFATRLVFDETDDATAIDFADFLLNHKVDGVLCLLPNSRIPNSVSRLIDRGTRSITIVNACPRNGRPGYYVSRRNAIKEALTTWKREGITSVTILHQTHSDFIERLGEAEACLREVALPYAFVDAAAAPPQDCFHALAQRKCSGILFASSDIVVRFGCHDRVQFEKLLSQRRALLLEGSVDFPVAGLVSAKVDSIQVDWRTAARRIGSDLLSFSPITKQNTVVFEAKLAPRTSIDGHQPRNGDIL